MLYRHFKRLSGYHPTNTTENNEVDDRCIDFVSAII